MPVFKSALYTSVSFWKLLLFIQHFAAGFASYSNRVIYQMKQDPQADDCVNEMFAGKQYDRTTECEGLTFSESPTFRDPKHKCVRHYAFKVDKGPLRVLIKVDCGVSLNFEKQYRTYFR
jgi:hypothetical protein